LLVSNPASNLDPVNLLLLCFGYCIPLVQWDYNRYTATKVLKNLRTGHDQQGGSSPSDHGRAAVVTVFVFSLAAVYTILRQDLTLNLTPTHHPSTPQHFTPTSPPTAPLHHIAISILVIK